MKDNYGRKIDYLRISLTDRCNLRCIYCMPEEGVPFRSHESVLRIEEIADFTRRAVKAGIRRVRLTGAELHIHRRSWALAERRISRRSAA